MYRIEINGGFITDGAEDEIIAQAQHFDKIIKDAGGEKISVKVFDYDKNRNISIAPRKAVKAFTGRQESEGVIQAVVRSLKASEFISEDHAAEVSEITENSLKFDEGLSHYSVDYGKLHDNLEKFAVDADAFAVQFKSVITDILLNNAAGGTAFMKKAKKG